MTELLSAPWIESQWVDLAIGAAFVCVVVAILLLLAIYFGWWLSNRSWESKEVHITGPQQRSAKKKDLAGTEPLPKYEDPWTQGLRCKPVDLNQRIATVEE